MPKLKLPEALREKIKELYQQGYQKEEVFRLVKTEGLIHVETEDELRRCLTSLKGRATVQGPPKGTKGTPESKYTGIAVVWGDSRPE